MLRIFSWKCCKIKSGTSEKEREQEMGWPPLTKRADTYFPFGDVRSLEACSASYASDRQDGIAQTSRHDTATGARNSLISVARMHDLPLSVRPVVAVIRRRAFACPSSEPGFTRVTPFRNTAARALPEIGRNYFQQRGPDSFVWLRDRTIYRLV